MKGKDTFTAAEIADLRELIRLRVKARYFLSCANICKFLKS